MSLATTQTKVRSALGIGFAAILCSAALPAVADQPTLSDEVFESSKQLYFEQCAGCHGVLRKGATGKNLLPHWKKTKADGTVVEGGTLQLGQERLAKIISWGTEGGMNNFSDIMTEEQIQDMATYIMMEPPKPPEMSLAQMRETRKVYVEEADYPTEPLHGRNWENFFVVIERDVGKVAIIDGDTKEVLTHIPTGYAVHVI
ncbi:MAG: c-type cytochrome, partial [Rhodobacteraceae bacterium]|nr:c-type cytochrome [Paracoccaceae bacterium]